MMIITAPIYASANLCSTYIYDDVIIARLNGTWKIDVFPRSSPQAGFHKWVRLLEGARSKIGTHKNVISYRGVAVYDY